MGLITGIGLFASILTIIAFFVSDEDARKKTLLIIVALVIIGSLGYFYLEESSGSSYVEPSVGATEEEVFNW